jgi:hypothetical protein
MVTIASGAAAKHLPREKRFAPKGDEALWVEIPRVKGPQAHVRIAAA